MWQEKRYEKKIWRNEKNHCKEPIVFTFYINLTLLLSIRCLHIEFKRKRNENKLTVKTLNFGCKIVKCLTIISFVFFLLFLFLFQLMVKINQIICVGNILFIVEFFTVPVFFLFFSFWVCRLTANNGKWKRKKRSTKDKWRTSFVTNANL